MIYIYRWVKWYCNLPKKHVEKIVSDIEKHIEGFSEKRNPKNDPFWVANLDVSGLFKFRDDEAAKILTDNTPQKFNIDT